MNGQADRSVRGHGEQHWQPARPWNQYAAEPQVRARCQRYFGVVAIAHQQRFAELESQAVKTTKERIEGEGADILSDTMATMDQSLLQAALTGLEAQRGRIEQQIETVRSLMSGPTERAETEPTTDQTPGRRKWRMSAAGRRAIVEAQRKRWAAIRVEQKAPATATKRGLTAAGRKRLAEAMKKRWAAKRTAGQAKKKAST